MAHIDAEETGTNNNEAHRKGTAVKVAITVLPALSAPEVSR